MKALSSEIVWSSSPDVLKYEAFFSVPELIEFPTEVPGQNAYAYYYPPTNPLYNASMEEKPPLLVKSHGMLKNDHFTIFLKFTKMLPQFQTCSS